MDVSLEKQFKLISTWASNTNVPWNEAKKCFLDDKYIVSLSSPHQGAAGLMSWVTSSGVPSFYTLQHSPGLPRY